MKIEKTVYEKKEGLFADKRMRSTLDELEDLLKKNSVYLCDAYSRSLLDPGNEAIRWTEEQRKKLGSLRELLHPKYFATSGEKAGKDARVVQMIMYSDEPKEKLDDLERCALWRVSHLFPVLAFCELIIALASASDEDRPDATPPVLGAVVAAKSVLELSAHFVSGGTSGECDPFDDATTFRYREGLRKLGEKLGKKDEKWKKAREWYDALCEALNGLPVDHEAISEICDSVVQFVLEIKEFRTQLSIPDSMGQLEVLEFDQALRGFEERKEPHVVLTYRLNYDEIRWPVSPETIGHSMLWTGIHSPRLQALGFKQVEAFDSPVFVDMTHLMKKLRTSDAKAEGLCRNANSLIHAFCVSKNLGNALALGAIARQLHLQVERLTEAVQLCDPYLERREDESEASSKEREPDEDDRSLRCIEEQLEDLSSQSTDLNVIRRRLQDILASFAHPGWLIRTELIQVKSNPARREQQALYMTTNYVPSAYAEVRCDELNGVSVVEIPLRNVEHNNFTFLISHYPPSLRSALTGPPDGETVAESAFDIPFVAFQFCRLALDVVLDQIGKGEVTK